MDELKFQSLPELAAALRKCTPGVLARWREEVVRILPQADELTRRQLEDDLPRILEQTAGALAASQPGPTQRLVTASPNHGTARFHQDFNLNELLIEYAILRRVLLEELIRELSRPLSSAEQIELHEAIDVALRQAAIVFTEHQKAELRAEANAMTKYLSFLSHDLRGGLNSVMLTIEVLRRELQADPRFASSVEDLDNMRQSMMETVRTMERFLDAEKLRRGRMPVKVEPINIRGLLDNAARGFVPQARSEGIELHIHADDALQVQSDQQLLVMIVQNLLSNAIKYGSGKPIEIRATAADPSSQAACRLAVIDHGPGVSPEKLSTLFAPYTRGETYGQKGVGLGLFIARQAAELIGAKVWAESKMGQGTQFYVELPRTPPRAESAATEQPNQPQP